MRRQGCLFSVKIRKNADGATADGLRKHENVVYPQIGWMRINIK